ncbi:MAG: hypothetical protein U0X87_04085 [Anaerolineales bacterium]
MIWSTQTLERFKQSRNTAGLNMRPLTGDANAGALHKHKKRYHWQYVKFRAIFSVHQGQQQLIRSAQFGGPPEVSQPFRDHRQHLIKSFALDAR